MISEDTKAASYAEQYLWLQSIGDGASSGSVNAGSIQVGAWDSRTVSISHIKQGNENAYVSMSGNLRASTSSYYSNDLGLGLARIYANAIDDTSNVDNIGVSTDICTDSLAQRSAANDQLASSIAYIDSGTVIDFT